MKEDNNRSSKNETKWTQAQRLLRKRWVLPAVYLAAAAAILSSVFYFQGQDLGSDLQDQGTQEQPGDQFETGYDPRDEEAVPVQSSSEVIVKPTLDEAEAEIIGHFYDESATAEEQQASLVYFSNTYRMNKGVDFGAQTEEGFDVVAALSGKVTKAQQDSTLGNVVEITHDDGVKTHYSSLASLAVEEGDTVSQGDKLGEAGRNLYNEAAGVHVHFEIRDNEGVALNPEEVFGQSLEQAVKESENAEKEAPEQGADEEKEEDKEDGEQEKAPADGEKSGLVPSESSNT
ncbi:M23 family metallopeptidase [Alkalicoccobacillus porphyridii]|uniref:M23 family metallopeptidase n=1 Tax=Alkalicoccobacillus porphyridii TaxID=2597270 RepID=A0A553ZTD4_9BACI|nr:M23 family metallopeptidase [Alkalicoccobacillus porphyridii]TSB44738.1 M23 family metallopeptidase [Alkalicoccobacillus porphyridii]